MLLTGTSFGKGVFMLCVNGICLCGGYEYDYILIRKMRWAEVFIKYGKPQKSEMVMKICSNGMVGLPV